MSRITDLAVSKRSVTLLLAVALFVGGIQAWGNLKQELLPDIQLPVITVIAPLPGAGASDVAEQVTKPIERAISSVPRLQRLQSTSANSIALVVAQFDYGSDVKETRAAIQQNIDALSLPQGVTPKVSSLDINASPVIVASISGTGQDGLASAAQVATKELVPELQGLDGVASADLTGGLQQRLVVTLEPAKLAAAGISVAQVQGVLQANNLTLPSGQIQVGTDRIPVSTVGRVASLDQVRALVVGARRPAAATGGATGTTGAGATGTPGSTASGAAAGSPAAGGTLPSAAAPVPVTIGDLGTVALAGIPTTGYARTNGQPSLTITVTKNANANTVDVADAVQARLATVHAAHPDLQVATVSDLSTFIKESRDGLLREGGLGALFAVITIFLFLFSLRSTLVAAVSIPLSVLTALVVMQVTGVTLNIMTLGGLAVAVGRVVDDAIVVLENIYRHRALGEDRRSAVLNGPREVAAAITSSTLTTVAVFLPIGFVGGIVSQFFLPFALTVTFALLASLLCALAVVPVLAYLFIGRVSTVVDEDGEPRNSIWVRAYTPTIRFALHNRWTKLGVVALATVLFVGSVSLVPRLPTTFISTGSEKILQVTIAPPSGTASDAVLAKAAEAERIVRADRNVQLVQISVPGEGDTGFGTLAAAFTGRAANSAIMELRLDPSVDLDAYTTKVGDELASFKDVGYDVGVQQATGFSSNGLSIIVSGADTAAVQQASDAVATALRARPDLRDVKSDLTKATPEVQVTVDPNKAIGLGLTAAQVGGEVRSALVGSTVTRVNLPDVGDVDVFLQLDPSQLRSVAALRQLPVGTVAKAPLGSVADVQQVATQGSITRVDQTPAATVSAAIGTRDTGAASRGAQQAVDALTASGAIPAGVTVRFSGVTQQQSDAFGGLYQSMAVAILLVYLMMVLAFNSLVTPFIILFSLPLAAIGVFPALLLTGRAVGVSALIGILMLIGIVVTNAIVLLDLVERLRRSGLPTTEALIEGGRTRVRPILMTAIATILALIPLAAGLSKGSIIAAELGTVVIGGLFSSTFLTLLVVPVVYSLVDGLKRRAPGSEPVAEAAPIGGPGRAQA
ncbi:MAG TPA: efflux RND transporter permease subunit [Candidatus Limnocylindrales bacterium]